MNLDETLTIREKYDALLELTQSRGYQLFLEMLGKLEPATIQQMMKAPDAHVMAKLAGKYELIQFVKGWAQGNVFNLRGYLEQEELQKKGQ